MAEPGRRTGARRLAAMVAVALATATIAACGGDGQKDAFAGQWVGRQGDSPVLVHILKKDDAYELRANPDKPLGTASVAGGALTIDTHAVVLVFTPKGDRLQLVATVTQGKKREQTIMLTRADEGEVADATVALNLTGLKAAIEAWASSHLDARGAPQYPPAKMVTPDGPLAALLDPWPANPFTGEPMRQGSAEGDFAYTAKENGRGFKLVGYGGGGKVIKTP